MLAANALIGLREGLEAALVVTILIAFLIKTGRRDALRFVWLGVGTAVGLSVLLGAMLTYGTNRLSFTAQEVVGGVTSIIAVAFVTGMIFWMRRAARTIATELRGQLSEALVVGSLAVAVVAFLGVGREGLETAIFFYAAAQAAESGATLPLIGFLIGLTAAVVLGWLMYQGAIRINLSKFFRVTGVLLVLVAGGILAYGIHDLQEARVLPGLNTLAFDVSATVPADSWYGTLLKGIFNFSPQTTVLEAITWLAYVSIVLTLFLWPRGKPATVASERPPTVSAGITREGQAQ